MKGLGGVVFLISAALVAVLFFLPLPVGRQVSETTREWTSPLLRLISFMRRSAIPDAELEIKRLQMEVQRLKIDNALLSGLQEENDRLRNVLRFKEESRFSLLAAEVQARSSQTWWEFVTINRGRADGVEEGMPVVSMEGLIGIVRSTTPGSAQVALIGDEQVRVAATVEGTDAQGILVGSPNALGIPLMRLTFLSRQSESLEGRRVVTSGLGGVFPPGLVIGRVTDSADTREAGGFGLFQEYFVVPSADLSNLDDVFVVIKVNQ